MTCRLYAGAVILLALVTDVRTTQYGLPVKTLPSKVDGYSNQQEARAPEITWPTAAQALSQPEISRPSQWPSWSSQPMTAMPPQTAQSFQFTPIRAPDNSQQFDQQSQHQQSIQQNSFNQQIPAGQANQQSSQPALNNFHVPDNSHQFAQQTYHQQSTQQNSFNQQIPAGQANQQSFHPAQNNPNVPENSHQFAQQTYHQQSTQQGYFNQPIPRSQLTYQSVPQAVPLRVSDNSQHIAQQSFNPHYTQQSNFNQQIATGQYGQQSQAVTQNQPVQLSAALQHVQYSEQQKTAEAAVVQASNYFSRDLFEEVRHQPGNLVISPFSVGAILALAWLGAHGYTAQQISKALYMPQDVNLVVDGYKQLFQTLKQTVGGAELDAVNKVFAQRGLRLRSEFQLAARHVFGAEAEELDFSQPAVAAATVNRWVSKRTRGKIEQLLEPGSLSPSTSLILANAVYFKGRWQKQFDPQSTSVLPFRTAPPGAGPTYNVTLMFIESDFPYAQVDQLEAKVLRMPYEGGRMSMLVILPNAVNGLEAVEAKLRTAQWPIWRLLEHLQLEQVEVWLPRFTAHSSFTLNGPLARLGLGELFGSRANFSGMAEGAGFLSSVVQKTYIDVNEEGTEAAAATGGLFLLSAGLYNFFKADHPFLFYIIDDQTGTILFQGHYLHPEQQFSN